MKTIEKLLNASNDKKAGKLWVEIEVNKPYFYYFYTRSWKCGFKTLINKKIIEIKEFSDTITIGSVRPLPDTFKKGEG